MKLKPQTPGSTSRNPRLAGTEYLSTGPESMFLSPSTPIILKRGEFVITRQKTTLRPFIGVGSIRA